MADVDPRSSGFPWGSTLAGLLVLLVLGAGVGAPLYLKSRRESRHRWITGALHTVDTVEFDFRANDRDWNKINDFWTGDVAGLYTVRSLKDGQEIQILPPLLARADAQPILPLVPTPQSSREYFFQALDQDLAFPNEPDAIYRMDTDGSGRKVHNRSRFGFCAFPEENVAGWPIFIVNENGTVWHRTDGKLHFNWPDDFELKYNYSRFGY